MPAAPHRPPARTHDDRATGLAALAVIVNDALAAMGTRPMFAMAGTEGSWPRAARPAMRSSVESPPTRRAPRPGPGTANGRAAGPTGPVRPDNSDSSGDSDDSDDGAGTPAEGTAGETVDADHVEIWELVHRAQAGDGEAFGVLYDRYVDLVFRFIYYRVNDRALAEDFTSETFLRALRRIGSISYQGRDIGAWFVTIARNIVLDHMKSARNRLETTTADTIESREYERSTEAAVLDTLQSERLMQAINELGDEQRECIMLRFIQGLSVSETAAIMGKNDGAIKALQHRAVRKLADLVGGELR